MTPASLWPPTPALNLSLIVPAGPVVPALAAVREEATRLDPLQALSAARPVEDVRNEWMTQPRLRTQMAVVFGAAVMLVTVVGLWARVSWDVASRGREWAIRQAVGAQPHEVVLAAVTEVAAVVVAGGIASLVLFPVSAAVVRATIAGLPEADPRLLLLAVAVFVACALASAYLPARRAGRIDPAGALRAE